MRVMLLRVWSTPLEEERLENLTLCRKCLVIVSQFYHDLGHAPHLSDVAARNAEH